jgi:hypothetical protein
MSEISLKQALDQVRWYSPQEIDEVRLNSIIDEKIRANRQTFRRKRNLPKELRKLKNGSY